MWGSIFHDFPLFVLEFGNIPTLDTVAQGKLLQHHTLSQLRDCEPAALVALAPELSEDLEPAVQARPYHGVKGWH